jgi:hypothetical protein
MKWKECVELCIKQEIKRLKVEGKKPLDGDREGEGKGEESEVNDGGREFETKLPLGHSNLVGLLTKNHKLTQGRTPVSGAAAEASLVSNLVAALVELRDCLLRFLLIYG